MTNMTGHHKTDATVSTTNNDMGLAGLNLLRVLISSYFIAVALSLVKGTDLTALAVLLLPGNLGIFAANTMVFILAYLVLMGMWLRPAVLLLATYVLASSIYATTLTTSPEIMSDLWRDITLIAGLMMSYINSSFRNRRGTPGRDDDNDHITPRRVAGLRETPSQRQNMSLQNDVRRDNAEIVNIFAA